MSDISSQIGHGGDASCLDVDEMEREYDKEAFAYYLHNKSWIRSLV